MLEGGLHTLLRNVSVI